MRRYKLIFSFVIIPWLFESYCYASVEKFFVLDIEVVGKRILAAGEHGQVIFSEDEGETWQQSAVKTKETITALHFKNNIGWAVGHGPSILQSIDLGKTWKLVNYDLGTSDPLFDIYFVDQNRGIIVGAYGLIFFTRDGGQTWSQSQISGEDPHLYTISFVSNRILFVAGEYGNLYRSDDFGESWLKIKSLYNGSFQKILNISNSELLLFGTRGEVFHYNIDKNNWIKTQSPIDTPIYSAAIINNKLVVGSMEGLVLVSLDMGKTFKVQRLPKQKSISVIYNLEDKFLLLGDMNGVTKIIFNVELYK